MNEITSFNDVGNELHKACGGLTVEGLSARWCEANWLVKDMSEILLQILMLYWNKNCCSMLSCSTSGK